MSPATNHRTGVTAMTRTPYIARFRSEDDAEARMLQRNRTARDGSIYCIVDGPEDDFAVVDLATAIDLGGPYRWAR